MARCVCVTRWCGRLTGQQRCSVRLVEVERSSVDKPAGVRFVRWACWVLSEMFGTMDISVLMRLYSLYIIHLCDSSKRTGEKKKSIKKYLK